MNKVTKDKMIVPCKANQPLKGNTKAIIGGNVMIQTTEQLVYNALLTNRHARQDDFILYGVVLKKIGISLNDSIGSFLATAKKRGFVPSFETVSRCRRKLQANNPALVDEDAQKERKEAQERFKEYSRK